MNTFLCYPAVDASGRPDLRQCPTYAALLKMRNSLLAVPLGLRDNVAHEITELLVKCSIQHI